LGVVSEFCETLDQSLSRLETDAGWAGCKFDKQATPELRVQLSIAHSLKRLADAICGDESNSGMVYMLDQIAVGVQS
jgi:hypothetical protein